MQPAGATEHALQPVLDDLHAHRWQVDDLASFGLDRRQAHIEPAAAGIAACRRTVQMHFVCDPLQCRPGVPFLPAGVGLAGHTPRLGFALKAIRRRRLAGVATVLQQQRFELIEAIQKRKNQRPR
jgi:hypothetical protein